MGLNGSGESITVGKTIRWVELRGLNKLRKTKRIAEILA